MKKTMGKFLFLVISVFLLSVSGSSGTQNHINYANVDLTDGLVSQWTFDEGKGNTISDQIAGGSGTLHGPTWGQGPVGGALEFDGVDDYVQLYPEQSVPSHLSSLDDGSLSIWFRADYISTEDGIAPLFYYGGFNACNNMIDASNEGFVVEVGHSPVHGQSQRIYFTAFGNGCNYPSFCVDSNQHLVEGQWYHFTLVVNGADNYNTIFLDGEELTNRRYNFGKWTTTEFFADAANGETIWLGKGYWETNTNYLKGAMDEIRIYDRPLSGTEVNALYELGDSAFLETENSKVNTTTEKALSSAEDEVTFPSIGLIMLPIILFRRRLVNKK